MPHASPEAPAGAPGVRLLLVEDDAALAQRIALALQQSGYVVDTVGTVREALDAIASDTYAISVLDLGLSDGDGLDVLQAWRERGVDSPVLILSTRGRLDHRIRALDAGADDYLLKPFLPDEIQARLRALLRRPRERAPTQRLGRLRFDRIGRRAFVDEREIDLTRREFDVLEQLMARAGRIVRRQDLIGAVFAAHADVGPNALEVHVSRLRRKLEPAGLQVRSLRGLGYRLDAAAFDGDGDA